VVDVAVAQDHRTDLVGRKGKGLAVFLYLLAAPLDQAAIEQYGLVVDTQNMAGTGYSAGCTVEFDMHGDCPSNQNMLVLTSQSGR